MKRMLLCTRLIGLGDTWFFKERNGVEVVERVCLLLLFLGLARVGEGKLRSDGLINIHLELYKCSYRIDSHSIL